MSRQMHEITREIGIDAGHRVTHHGSKCKNLHGHRYTIQATCRGPLFPNGEQQGMVLDFGFLKEEMVNEIDTYCDHGTILWVDDPFLLDFAKRDAERIQEWSKAVKEEGFCLDMASAFGKLYIVPFVPTAENLARHWFLRLQPRVLVRTDKQAELVKVKVYETPNCSAEYTA